MYQEEFSFLNKVPSFRFDTSKTIIATVDDYSTVRYEKNYYSVPTKYLRKDVTVKGYGNNVQVFYQNITREVLAEKNFEEILNKLPAAILKFDSEQNIVLCGKLFPGTVCINNPSIFI